MSTRLLVALLLTGCPTMAEVDVGPTDVPAADAPGVDVPGLDAGPTPDAPITRIDCAAVACRYVTPDGSGARDGSRWADAYAGLPSSGEHPYVHLPEAELERGVVYFVADGTYSGYVLPAPSGTEPITIRKATVPDHGASDGWADTMGDGEAVFEGAASVFVFRPGARAYVIDGVFGSGRSPGGYGIRLRGTGPRAEGGALVTIDQSGVWDEVGDTHDITLTHLELDWNNGTPAGPCAITKGLEVQGALDNTDWTLASSYVHHASGGVAYFRNGGGHRLRDDYFHQMGDETGSGACPGAPDHGHWEIFWLWGDDYELTGNTFENAYPAGLTGWVMMSGRGFLLEGNTLFCSDMDACSTGGNGVMAGWSADPVADVLITHNTFRDLYGGSRFLFEMGTNVVIRDNTYIDAPGLADTE